ncbi:MAG: phage major capsid protein, partial [Candidatus Dormibacteraeota bacterium]|nr:phage major capsid protein [Candidatus Dormibacteraeota bacterium]
MQLHDQIRDIEVRLEVDGSDAGLEQRRDNLKRGVERFVAQERDLSDEYRAELTRRIENGTVQTENEADQIASARRRVADDADEDPRRRQDRDKALRVVERCHQAGPMSSRAAASVENLVRYQDPAGIGARYIEAVGNPDYNSAFGKLLRYGEGASMRMSPDELEAVRRVTRVEEMRTLAVGTGSTGGFAVPITIDPTILLTSSGVLNPIREVADVRHIVSDTLRLVTADTPTATYAAELTEAADSSPTLVQPIVQTQRGQAFIPFSIELGQDWAEIQQELGKLLADAQAILDATMFLT